jgi:hypothetical protein
MILFLRSESVHQVLFWITVIASGAKQSTLAKH